MGSTDFLKSVRASFVSAAELVVSVACSDDKHPLSIQDAARVILACTRPSLGDVALMKLEGTGLPDADPDGTAIQAIERLASVEEDLTLLLPRRNEAFKSICNECRDHGFNDAIWAHLAAAGIGTQRRADPNTGIATNTLLSSLLSSTPSEIAVFLEQLGHKCRNTIRVLRDGYEASEIATLAPSARKSFLDIDQKIDLWDAARWLEHQGVKCPIPKLANTQSIASEARQEPITTKPHENTNEADHLRLEINRLSKKIRELEAQLKQHECASSGVVFPYATKALEAMRAAVAQYWEGYTPDKKQPKQRVVGHTIGELLGLPSQSNNDPARKAIALASAIKPDTLPDG